MIDTKQVQDGGPAFPIEPIRDHNTGEGLVDGCNGMSLRDWFAGQALIGLCVHGLGNQPDLAHGVRGGNLEAKAAYVLADAMLRARLGGVG